MPDFKTVNAHLNPRGVFEKVPSESPCRKTAHTLAEKINNERELNATQKGREKLNAEYFQQKLSQTAPINRRRKLVNLAITICAFDVMHELAQSEFEKAVLLKREVAKDFILLPLINHYLDRTVFFAQLSQQTNNIVHLNKAYKRAHLVCMVIKYFLKDKHLNLEPSTRLITAMRKGLYL